MCGINGIIDFLHQGDKYEPDVRRMNNALSHRGPDADGVFIQGSACLGHRRLSIIDTSASGNQPFTDVSGRFTVVYNGELYNYLELKKELNYPFQTETDTEVLLAAFIRWGANCVHFLRGMFAFAIWDSEKQSLFIARDRMGIKPLYYAHIGSKLIYASEIRAILSSGQVEAKTDKSTVFEFLRFQTVFAPRTMITGVQMLEPGCYLTFDNTGLRINRWWDAEKFIGKNQGDKVETQGEVKRLLKNAVRERLMADVPFGAFLSGGIDSSVIVALMAETSSHQVKTFSVVFDEKNFSEEKYSRMIAEKYQTDHEEILLTPETFLEKVPAAIDALDHPSGDGPNTYVISEATRKKGIKMALSGLGGDELFGGYSYFGTAARIQNNSAWLNTLPAPVLSAVIKGREIGGGPTMLRKLNDVLKGGRLDNYNFYPYIRKVWIENDLERICSDTIQDSPLYQFPPVKGGNRQNSISSISFSEMKYYMQNVLLRDTDQMSMAHGLEVRVPFLAHDLVEYTLGLSDTMKKGLLGKQLLIDSFKDELPPAIYNRPKMGFVLPWEKWLRNELSDYCGLRISILSQRDLFNGEQLMEEWTKFMKGDNQISWSRWWLLVVLENWLTTNKVEIV